MHPKTATVFIREANFWKTIAIGSAKKPLIPEADARHKH